MFRVLLVIVLLLPLPAVAQAVTKDDILQAASDIQKAVGGSLGKTDRAAHRDTALSFCTGLATTE
jgi:hypothetical protein